MAIELEPDGTAVRLSLSPDQESGQVARLEAADIDDLIARLVEARAGMWPAISGQLGPDTSPVHICDNLLWQVDADPQSRTVRLALYNGGLGWMTVRLHREQVEDLHTSIEFAMNDLVQAIRRQPETSHRGGNLKLVG